MNSNTFRLVDNLQKYRHDNVLLFKIEKKNVVRNSNNLKKHVV